jgi:hypothetical protein
MPRPQTLDNIRTALAEKHLLRLKVRGNLREAPFGIPIALSDELVVLHALRDFDPDGYCAVPTSRVLAARSRDFEHSYDRVCAALKITDTILPPGPELDTTDLISLCNTLRRQNHFVIVEALTADEDGFRDNTFFIGRLTGLSDAALAIHNFDANGAWDPSPTTVPLGRVLNIQWNSRYIQTWQRFLSLPQ